MDESPNKPERRKVTIESLPDEVLDYVFSFLDFFQRSRIEKVCRRWCRVGGRPAHLYLDVDCVKNRKLDDEVLCSILSRRGETLTDLVLKSNFDLTGESLNKIGDYCPNLTGLELHLLHNRQFTCLRDIAPRCPKLRALRLKNYDNVDDYSYNKGLLTVVRNCKALDSLHLSYLSEISLNWLEKINPNLRIFSLFRCGLSSAGLQCLMRRCENIQEFTLDGCNLWQPPVLFEFFKHFRKSLRVVRISYEFYWNLDWNDALKKLANVEVLRLFCCDIVDDTLMATISKNCMKIRCLDIGFTEVTDLGLKHLLRLPLLRELRIDERTKVTGQGLEALLANGVLQQITIPPHSTELNKSCSRLALTYPNVRFILGKDNGWVYWGESRPRRCFAV